YATLSWTVGWFGLDVFKLRLGNVLLHAANAIALFFLLRRLFRVTLADDPAAGRPAWTGFAFLGALLFALHPVAVYDVVYLIQRSTLMATLFVLLMLILYLEGLLRGGWAWMVGAALCYFAAVLSKEHSVMAPGVAIALTLLIRKPSAALLKQTAPYYILILIASVTALVVLRARGILGQAYEPHGLIMLEQFARTHGLAGLADLPNLHLLSILTQSALFFKYLGLWLLPNPGWMSVDMREPFALSLLGAQTLGFAAFLAYCCAAVWLLLERGRAGLLGFALLFPGIMFLTEFSAVRIQEPFVLYRSYLWMPGLLAALPLAVGGLKPARAFALLGILCLALVPLTLNRLHTFSSPLLLWDDAEKLVRGKPDAIDAARIYINRGGELGKLRRYEAAIADFNKAIALSPLENSLTYRNRAAAYYYLGKYQESLHDYDRAIELQPKHPDAYSGRALTYRALGDFAKAHEDIELYCTLKSLNPGCH
ncbi:MAG: tetratricopeptide repeat protein, partial [Nitrosomonadales bacterium]|nr:tetratricopeptide repeat protein [Nitrosomonadales bacterium]